MNRALDWHKADWSKSDEEIAKCVGCTIFAVTSRRKKLNDKNQKCRKKEFSCNAPSINLRLEKDVYNSLEFLGVAAGEYKKIIHINDVIRTAIIQFVKNFGETYCEEQESLKNFLSSDTAKKAENIYKSIEYNTKLLKETRNAVGECIFALNLEDALLNIGIDHWRRNSYRQLSRIKRGSRYTPYVFQVHVVPIRNDLHIRDNTPISITIYAPAKSWTDACELSFEDKNGKPLVLGFDLAENKNDILRGLPKEASPSELFHRIFRDWTTLDVLRPSFKDNRIVEANCEPGAYRLYQQYNGEQQPN